MLTKLMVLLLLVQINIAQNNDCQHVATCGECIQKPECVWCHDPEDNTRHCQIKNISQCKSKEIVNHTLTIIKDNDLSSDINSKSFVQIKPQHVKLTIPKNQEHSIKFKFARAQNPLDLYFLMDASYTMRQYKTLISELVEKLVKEIKGHTTEYKLGFGTFVDKIVPPFNYDGYSSNQCKECMNGYTFKNQLSLTEDVDEFKIKINNTPTATNIDAPEGGLEALLQVIACKKKIGWKDNSTRLVVFTTDDYSHIAGDGRLGGAIHPSDGTCYTNENDAHIYDYPSISHISYLAEEHGVHVIFAIAEGSTRTAEENYKIQQSYKEMSNNARLSKYSKLTYNSNDIIKLVTETYTEILRSVKMSHNFDKSKFEVKFKAKCSKNSDVEEKDNCDNVKIGKEIEFEAIIKPVDCSGTKEQYVIKADGIDESLIVDLEVICNCTCENEISKNPVENCSNAGYKKCGQCVCNDGHTGIHCECSTEDKAKNATCIDSDTKLTCNNKGICNCGVCECNANYYGTFCLCEDVSCPRKNGELCSGKDHGNCKCGKCECLPSWSGEDCSCLKAKTPCIAPYSDGTHCSGQGDCICGKCQCKTDYFGEFCEGCKGCEWCDDLDPCVKAYLEDSNVAEEKRINCSSVNIIPRSNASSEFYDNEWKKCLLSGTLGCNTAYKYKIDDKQILIEIGEEICPFVASIEGLLLVTLLPILIGGIIAFLAWKAIVTVKDGREYARFCEKKKLEKWSAEENPLYKEVKVCYKNPTFHDKSTKS
nr:integrin beta-PS-like [Onthophagus taurus]